MNIKNYKLFLEKNRWDDSTYDPYDEDDEDFTDYDDIDRYHQEDDDIEEDDMDHLLHLLRTMFKNAGIEAKVSNKKMNMLIYIELTPKERLKNIISIFEVVNKLKKDILIQYSCEFEMWETKIGRPYFEFAFYYDDKENVF